MYKYTIDNKPLFVKDNGDVVRDLTDGAFDMSRFLTSDYKVFRVSSSMVMRPDLIANSAYGSSEYTEMVMKYNNISNPFSIDEDDIVIIPNKESILDVVLSTSSMDDNELVLKSYKYIDPTKFPVNTSSGTVKEFENRMDVILPPNISDINEEQVSMRNGRVYFGENIGKSCLYDGMSSGEYLQQIVKNNKI